MVEKQNINVSRIVAVGLVAAVLLFVAVVGLQAWYHNEVDDERVIKHQGTVNLDLTNHEMMQQERLQSYRKVDEEKQTVTIPIDEAIRLTAKKYEGSRNEPRPSGSGGSNEPRPSGSGFNENTGAPSKTPAP